MIEGGGPTEVQTEIHDYLKSKVVRRRLLPRAVLVGVMSGSVAVAFRLALVTAEALRNQLMKELPHSPWIIAGCAALIAGAGTWIALSIGRLDPDAGGSGIPHMKAVLEGHSTLHWRRLLWVKFTAALAAIGSGLALGREGPTVQMGGATGLAVSEFTGASGRERRALIAAGAGAGLAAAFNAPLAGVTFVLEELQRDFQPVVFGAVLLSAAVATAISRLAAGQIPVFQVPPIPAPSLAYLPLFIVLGGAGGLVGVLFNRTLLRGTAQFAKWKTKSLPVVIGGVGVVVGCAFLLSPSLLGGGHELSEIALRGDLLLIPALVLLAARFVVVQVSYATGVPGGIFAPLLSLGALLGVVMFRTTTLLFPAGGLSISACAVAGMCAVFSGVVRAPLTGIILIGEMTGSYDLLLPLLVAAFSAYSVAEALKDTPIYEALLQRDALKKGWDLGDDEPLTAEFQVNGGSPFEGKAIRELRLPSGVLIILCKAEGKEFVPDANTVLHEHMKIVVATSSAEGLRDLQIGVQAPSMTAGKR